MYVFVYSLGLFTGLVLAGLFFGWRHKRRPRADVHLRIKRGQSPQEIVSSMVTAMSSADDRFKRLQASEKYWRGRAAEAERQRDRAEGRYDLIEGQFENGKGH